MTVPIDWLAASLGTVIGRGRSLQRVTVRHEARCYFNSGYVPGVMITVVPDTGKLQTTPLIIKNNRPYLYYTDDLTARWCLADLDYRRKPMALSNSRAETRDDEHLSLIKDMHVTADNLNQYLEVVEAARSYAERVIHDLVFKISHPDLKGFQGIEG